MPFCVFIVLAPLYFVFIVFFYSFTEIQLSSIFESYCPSIVPPHSVAL